MASTSTTTPNSTGRDDREDNQPAATAAAVSFEADDKVSALKQAHAAKQSKNTWKRKMPPNTSRRKCIGVRRKGQYKIYKKRAAAATGNTSNAQNNGHVSHDS